jgi:hypothetical protein
MAVDPQEILDPAQQRQLASSLFNRVWDLLDLGDSRSADQTAEMIDAAHASRYLWRQIGGREQAVVGEWQISRAYASAGLGSEAVRHAELSEQLLGDGLDCSDWIPASVHEGMARALLAAGDHTAARALAASAFVALDRIADPEDRELIASQLAELNLD